MLRLYFDELWLTSEGSKLGAAIILVGENGSWLLVLLCVVKMRNFRHRVLLILEYVSTFGLCQPTS